MYLAVQEVAIGPTLKDAELRQLKHLKNLVLPQTRKW